jgi:hypothetical protein
MIFGFYFFLYKKTNKATLVIAWWDFWDKKLFLSMHFYQ